MESNNLNNLEENKEIISMADKMKFWKYFLKQPKLSEEKNAWSKIWIKFWQKKMFWIMYNAWLKYFKRKDYGHVFWIVVKNTETIIKAKKKNFNEDIDLNHDDRKYLEKIFRQFVYLFDKPKHHFDTVEAIIEKEKQEKIWLKEKTKTALKKVFFKKKLT